MPKITEFEEDPGLAALQEAVGGYIEVVPYFTVYKERMCTVLCNEEGKLVGAAPNNEATAAWRASFPTDDVLVGDIAVVYGGLK